MTGTRVWTRQAGRTFSDDVIVALNKRYGRELQKRGYGCKEATRLLLERILYEAAFHYESTRWVKDAGYLGADTLNKVEACAEDLLTLLSDEVNHHRLTVAMLDSVALPDALDESGHSRFLAELIVNLRRLREVAATARRPPRTREQGRPESIRDIKVAYEFLAKQAIHLFGTENFINAWEEDAGRQPTIPRGWGTVLVFDVMRAIDPEREKLANSLRSLMAETVKELPGPRTGRRLG